MSLPAPTAGLPPAAIYAVLAAAAVFAAMGARAVAGPRGASAFFGVAVQDRPGLAFVRAMGGRNLALSLTAAVLALTGSRVGVAALLTGAALAAMVDAFAVLRAAGPKAARKHYAYVAALGLAASAMLFL